VTQHRLLILLATICLAASGLPRPAWAHPGHGPLDESAAVRVGFGDPGDPMSRTSPSSERHHAPPAIALVAGALALLAGLPRRRRTFAFVLALLLTTVALEGAVHAVLHLRHLPHADGLAIGASAAPQAATDLDSAAPSENILAPLGKALERSVALVTETAITPNQGRAPPAFPA
jgi:hypothetical protein